MKSYKPPLSGSGFYVWCFLFLPHWELSDSGQMNKRFKNRLLPHPLPRYADDGEPSASRSGTTHLGWVLLLLKVPHQKENQEPEWHQLFQQSPREPEPETALKELVWLTLGRERGPLLHGEDTWAGAQGWKRLGWSFLTIKTLTTLAFWQTQTQQNVCRSFSNWDEIVIIIFQLKEMHLFCLALA